MATVTVVLTTTSPVTTAGAKQAAKQMARALQRGTVGGSGPVDTIITTASGVSAANGPGKETVAVTSVTVA